ncbi:MAG: hypothetical protein PVI99_05800 [Anaerolineales bacterium]
MPVKRTVENNVLYSNALPEMTLHVSSDFDYLGSLIFDLKDIALVERHIFVEAESGIAVRMFIVQFEGFMPDNDYTYNWLIRTPMTLCGAEWQQNPYFFNNAENILTDPGAESDHTTRFLKANGLAVEDELMMSRFARVVDDAQRHEIILFYIENVSSTGYTLEEFSVDGDIRLEFQQIADKLVARSLQHFKLAGYEEKRLEQQ